MLIEPRHALPTIVVACLFPLCCACKREKHDTKPPMGATTVEELVERYGRAHRNRDIADLRGILQWESQLSYHVPAREKPMVDLFEMPLAEVRYVAGPPLQDKDGGEARYLLPRPGKQPQEVRMIGPICGKLLLIEKTTDGQKPRVLDPAYIVTQFHQFDGRYYIDTDGPVAEDAARAYKSNAAPKYIPQPWR